MMEEVVANSMEIDASESQPPEGETSRDGLNPLNEPLILRQVFLNLSTLDLVNCSEVNKMWNYEARSVLRDFKTCVATNKGHRPCRSLHDLDADLSRMTIVPYSGLRIRICKHRHCFFTTDTTSSELNFLRNHFKLKLLQIEWEWSRDANPCLRYSCPALRLVESIMSNQNVMDTLEEVDFVKIPSCTVFSLLISTTGSYPKLKAIRSPPSLGSDIARHFRERLSMRDFLVAAPKLETLDLEWSEIDFRILAQCQKFKLVRNYRLNPLSWLEDDQELLEILLQQPALTLERLSASTVNGFIHAPMLDSLRLVLLSSAKTLKILKLDLVLLATLRSVHTQPLESLQMLEIGFSRRWYEDEALLAEICRLNFRHLFPKINSVTVYLAPGQRGIPLPLLLADALEVEAGDLTQISELVCSSGSLVFDYRQSVAKLSEIFPCVTSLTFDAYVAAYPYLWSSWMHLKSASITVRAVCDPLYNLDAEFCGISAAEVAFLKDKDDEFLKNYHVVPVQPSLYSMKSLTQLHISVNYLGEHALWAVREMNIADFFLSKITGYLVLSRMKPLAITVDCSPRALQHLGSFVKLIEKNDDDVAGSSDEEEG